MAQGGRGTLFQGHSQDSKPESDIPRQATAVSLIVWGNPGMSRSLGARRMGEGAEMERRERGGREMEGGKVIVSLEIVPANC